MILVKIDVFDVNKKVQKGTKRSSGPKTDFLGQQKRGGGRADLKIAGVKKLSSFIWTLVVNKEKWKKGSIYGPLKPYGPYIWALGEGVSDSGADIHEAS